MKDEEIINRAKLVLFSESIGCTFFVGKLEAVVEGVDKDLMMVKSDYGDFHISLCTLWGAPDGDEPSMMSDADARADEAADNAPTPYDP